ncbi:hypothetical protein [Paenibacillus dokdonensis]|uniref:hypothetical protein n=1 Tax=Paenibacillus dokdonensis TaxID=2567944 RepID=UPI0010A87C1E|nr:hypothetical protein [Paenibacillus dokdonensis]
MAETLNYRMNLVIDPKNVIKANRELRAMERYFERIQGRVMRIGRTRMAPEIMLKDRASKGLDGILGKINRVKSQIINASGAVRVEVRQEQSRQEQPNGKKHAMKAPSMPQAVLIFPDFTPMVQAVNANSVASMINSRLLIINAGYLANLANALNSIKIGGSGPKEEEKNQPKSFWEKFKSGVTFAKNATATVKGAKDVKENWGNLKEDWGEQDPISGRTSREKAASTAKKIWNNKGRIVDLASSVTETLEGGTGVADSVMGLFSGGGSSTSSAITHSVSEVAGSGSGIASKLLKGGGKKLLGPLGYAVDAFNIVKAKPGKERAQAIGSAAGGAIGSVLGGAVGSLIPIPVVGTAIGSVVGGAVGDFVGGKVGGMVADYAPKIKETFSSVNGWFSKTFSGKKDKPKADISQKPNEIISQPTHSGSRGSFGPPVPVYPIGASAAATDGLIGPRLQSAAAPVTSASKTIPQLVQISPEQMSTFSGLLQDFKTETTVNYNLPPGAVQVTVHEEHPIDIEGLIQQIGQRLRAEFQKATQNQKPAARAYAL